MAGLSFERALSLVKKLEGGYVNDPNDPGGPTNFGVTQASYDGWLGKHGKASQTVSKITAAEVSDLYRECYWQPCGAEALLEDNPALSFVLFDGAVHQGVGAAVKQLQRLLPIKVDGVFGPNTKAAALARTPQQIVQEYVSGRTFFLMNLAKNSPKLATFKGGWLNRMRLVSAIAGDILKGGVFI
jgi:lysozyme family protein